MYNFAVFISVLAFIASLFSVIYNLGYAKVNVLHSIQKLLLDKAKDCNLIYETTFENWSNRLYPAGMPSPPYSYGSVIDEIIISIQLLDNSLAEYTQMKKRDFFLKQFWIQLKPSIREHFKTMGIVTGQNNTQLDQKNTIIKAFKPYFDKY